MKKIRHIVFTAFAMSACWGHASLKDMRELAYQSVMTEAKQAYPKYTEFIMTERIPFQGYLSRAKDDSSTYEMFTSSAVPSNQVFPCFSFGVQMGVKDLLGQFELQESIVREACVMGSEVVQKSKVPNLQAVSNFVYLRLYCKGQESGMLKHAQHSFKVSTLNLESEQPGMMRYLDEYYVDGKFKFMNPKYCSMDFVQGRLECEYSADGNNGRLEVDFKNYRQEKRSLLCDLFNGAGCSKTLFAGKINFGRSKANVTCE